MAQDLAQFQNEEPVIDVQGVRSKAEGFDAYAKEFGQARDDAGQVAQNIEEEKSNAQFMTSANLAEELKTNSQIDMIKQPGNADQIAANAAITYDSIKKSAYVNKADRQKLEFMVDRNLDETNLKAAQVSFDQANRGIAISLWDQLPQTNKQILDALNRGDFQTAKTLEDTLHANALAAARSGAISPEQFGTIRKTTSDLYDQAAQLHNLTSNPDGITAEQYHAANAPVFGNAPMQQSGANEPVDGNTQWLSNHYNNDMTAEGQINNLLSNRPIAWGAVASGTPEQVNKFKLNLLGVNAVRGMITAGTPFPIIQQRMDDIEANPNASVEEKAAAAYWKGINYNFRTGDGFYSFMGSTVLGQQAAANHNANRQALIANTMPGDDLAEKLRQEDNNFIGTSLNNALAMHLPPEFINPVPSEYNQDIRSSFIKGASVLPAIQRLSYLDPRYRVYAANAMPVTKPEQGMSVLIAGETIGKTDPAFQANLIAANQDPTTNSIDDKKASDNKTATLIQEKGTRDNDIWGDITSNSDFKSLVNHFTKQANGPVMLTGLKKAALNYIYDQANRAGDTNLDNLDKYETDFMSNTLKGFNLYQTDRASMNLNDLNIDRQQDADHLVNYALTNAYAKIHQGRSDIEFQQYVDTNPLMVVSTPDRRIVVIDRFGRAASDIRGNAAFDMPYTSTMLSAARKVNDELSGYGANDAIAQLVKNQFMFKGQKADESLSSLIKRAK